MSLSILLGVDVIFNTQVGYMSKDKEFEIFRLHSSIAVFLFVWLCRAEETVYGLFGAFRDSVFR